MAEQVLVQFRTDKLLKQQATTIFQALGMDLPTAIRMFMKRSVLERGLPFEVKLPENTIAENDGVDAFYEARKALADLPEMSLEEINAEIAQARAERKAKA